MAEAADDSGIPHFRMPIRGDRVRPGFDQHGETLCPGMRLNRPPVIGLTLIAFGLALTACNPGAGVRHVGPDPGTGPLRLVAYDSCDAAMKSLKAAARLTTSQYRGTPIPAARPGVGQAVSGTTRSAAPAAPSTVTSAPDYSGTNVHGLG